VPSGGRFGSLLRPLLAGMAEAGAQRKGSLVRGHPARGHSQRGNGWACLSAAALLCLVGQARGGSAAVGELRLGAFAPPPTMLKSLPLSRGPVSVGTLRNSRSLRRRSPDTSPRMSALSLPAVISPTAASFIIPRIALKQALLPIVVVVVLCVLAAVPLSPSLNAKVPVVPDDPESPEFEKQSKLKKALGLQRRVFTSVALGAVVSAWIFSGTWAFALVLAWVGSKGLLEYYNLAQASQDCRPAKKCGVTTLGLMMITACGTAYGLPFAYTDCVLPLAYIGIIAYLITLKRTEKATIADVQTTFMGIFYVGYLPSFWVRLRALGAIPASDVYAMMFTSKSSWLSAGPLWLYPDIFTQGAIVTWWTMISIAAADVGAYFTGKNFGKTKLSEATGITISPNKTVEGFFGGVALSCVFMTTGARLMRWPIWWLTGPAYGFMISSLGLLGDLTVSLFKRDAGVKDTGNVLPGHGGLLDRVDSYLLTAMPVYYFVKFISQWVKV